MKHNILFAAFAVTMLTACGGNEQIRVACVGDSITEGHGIKIQSRDDYPVVLNRILGDGYSVQNCGKSGTTVQKDADYPNLLNAARKAVEHGYQVYILPNPRGTRTADFIFVRRNIYKLFDLKTISGKTIVESQLLSSIGQANRALLNMTADYNPSLLARSIKKYFERNDEALEVLIFKGKKSISVSRDLTLSPDYYRIFMRRYVK